MNSIIYILNYNTIHHSGSVQYGTAEELSIKSRLFLGYRDGELLLGYISIRNKSFLNNLLLDLKNDQRY